MTPWLGEAWDRVVGDVEVYRNRLEAGGTAGEGAWAGLLGGEGDERGELAERLSGLAAELRLRELAAVVDGESHQGEIAVVESVTAARLRRIGPGVPFARRRRHSRPHPVVARCVGSMPRAIT